MKKLLAIAALAFGLAGAAQATTVAGNVDGDWTGENGSPISFINLFNSDQLVWGSILNGSTLTIDDGGFSDTVGMGLNQVTIANLVWYNASTLNFLTPDFSAFADFAVNWTVPGAAGGSESVVLSINNTANPMGDDISFSVSTAPFDFGAPYALSPAVRVLGYSIVHSGAGYFAGGSWFNPENGTSTLSLVANVEVVPLPAAAWMLLAGIGGLAAVARRKKAA